MAYREDNEAQVAEANVVAEEVEGAEDAQAAAEAARLDPALMLVEADVIHIYDDYTDTGNIPNRLHKLPQMLDRARPVKQLELAAKLTRRMLSVERNPPIDQMLQLGILPMLIDLLSYDIQKSATVPLEVAWALTNIASGSRDHTRILVDADCVRHLTRLLLLPLEQHAGLVEQAVWAMANIASDFVAEVIKLPATRFALETLVKRCAEPQQPSFVKTLMWGVSNILRQKPEPEKARTLTVEVARILVAGKLKERREAMADALWTVSLGLQDNNGDDNTIALISACDDQNIDILSYLMSVLRDHNSQHEGHDLVTPALRAIGNVASCTDHICERVVQLGAIESVNDFLYNIVNAQDSYASLRKESWWFMSNIAAGTEDQALRMSEVIMDTMRVYLELEPNVLSARVAKEVFWTLSNMAVHTKCQKVMFKKFESVFELLRKQATHVKSYQDVMAEFFKHITRSFSALVEEGVVTGELVMLVRDGTCSLEEAVSDSLHCDELKQELTRFLEVLEEQVGGEGLGERVAQMAEDVQFIDLEEEVEGEVEGEGEGEGEVEGAGEVEGQ